MLEVDDLVKHFTGRRACSGSGAVVHAVDGVSFTLGRGEMLGLVGESGSGKSTVAKCVLRLVEPTGGTIRLNGTDITHLSRRQMRPLRRELHIVFQDPYSSLNPRMTVRRHRRRAAAPARLASGRALDATRRRRSSTPSGCARSCATATRTSSRAASASASGSRARSSSEPSVLVADEPVSALDVSVQASILNLLARPPAASWASRASSSRTTSRRSSTSATASR